MVAIVWSEMSLHDGIDPIRLIACNDPTRQAFSINEVPGIFYKTGPHEWCCARDQSILRSSSNYEHQTLTFEDGSSVYGKFMWRPASASEGLEHPKPTISKAEAHFRLVLQLIGSSRGEDATMLVKIAQMALDNYPEEQNA